MTEDIVVFRELLLDIFPQSNAMATSAPHILDKIKQICDEQHLLISAPWQDKLLQFYNTLKVRHGIMLTGPTGTGKTKTWTVLAEALRRTKECDVQCYVIDPKAVRSPSTKRQN